MMSEIEREDDENNAEGHGDLLDDFVSSAVVPVGFCNHPCTLGYPCCCAFRNSFDCRS